MRSYNDRALVLRTRVFGEADRVAVLLTANQGRVDALVKGVRRTKSKFGARLEPFSHVNVQCHTGRTFHYVTQAESIRAYGPPLAADYEAYTYAGVVAEVALKLTSDDWDSAPAFFPLTLGAVAALATRRYHPDAVLASYLFRSLSIAGWQPTFEACALCGMPGPHRAFDIANGGAVCVRCRTPGARNVAEHVMLLGAAVSSSTWDHPLIGNTTWCPEVRALACRYAQWHLESKVSSLAALSRPATELDGVSAPSQQPRTVHEPAVTRNAQ